MKRLAALILAALLAVCTLSLTASAERQDCEYAENWQGAKVAEVTDRHGITYLVMNEPGTAYYDFHMNPDERYFYIVVRAGNYQGRGGCSFRLDCLDESGNTVNTFGSTVIAGDGSFYRTELGYAPDGVYFVIPEGTAAMRLSVIYEGGKNSPYFDVNADFSAFAANVHRDSEWTAPVKQSQVDVETTTLGMVLSVGFVCAVAGIMMIVAMVRKKYTKGRIKK